MWSLGLVEFSQENFIITRKKNKIQKKKKKPYYTQKGQDIATFIFVFVLTITRIHDVYTH